MGGEKKRGERGGAYGIMCTFVSTELFANTARERRKEKRRRRGWKTKKRGGGFLLAVGQAII